ncbi:MAG: DUF3313 family protein [Arenimonas sp.]|nr:DUF3313 family protein [Arenimonas sp.]
MFSKMNVLALLAFAMIGSAQAADGLPTTWDGLVEVKPKRMEAAYLLPGADFRSYTKVMIDPSEIAFSQDWLRNMNSQNTSLNGYITKADAQKILAQASQSFDQVFAETMSKNGYTVVTTPGADVLRLEPAVINLYINAPQINGPQMGQTYVVNAGEGTLVIDAHDSETNTLLGRVIDARETRESGGMQFSSQVGNLNDFKALVNTWATICSKGLDELKAQSPVPMDLKPKQKM